MSGADIAAEIAAAFVEVGEAVGDGVLTCTLRKTTSAAKPFDPQADATTLHELTALDEGYRQQKDGGRVHRLSLDATGVVPEVADEIAIGVTIDEIAPATQFVAIANVQRVAPAGTAIVYEVEIKD